MKEQKSAKVYSKYVHDMNTDGSMASVADDKTKHALDDASGDV